MIPQQDFNHSEYKNSVRRGHIVKTAFLILLFTVIAIASLQWAKGLASREIDIKNDSTLWEKVAFLFPFSQDRPIDTDYIMPSAEKNRLDILVLGLRGKDDPDGGLLTDTIMLFSFDRISKKTALVSIPRDLYVKITDDRRDKINTAYEYLGLNGAKKLISKITGVYIDNAIVFDFTSFKQIVDDIGGIDIMLDKPFEETTQWGYVFSLPAGLNHLNGEAALYYVRSRYSSSDFDRARRQQEIIFAIKDRIAQMDILSDTTRALNLMNTIRKNIQTDINILDIKGLIELAQQINGALIKNGVLTTLDVLYEDHINGMYVLLPTGDSFAPLKEYFANILN